ncbi:MAG: hypothetical protein AB1Z67_10935 [Candidatus Limnocylindrales bacterium]
MISPSDPGLASQPGAEPEEVAEASTAPDASASPSDTTLDGPVPVVAPTITVPRDGTVIGEFEIAVTVDVPDDRTVKRRDLDLYVYNGSQLEETLEKPKPGTTVEVEGIRLAPGENVLTAKLGSPAGPGPASEPHRITLDEDAPVLTIVEPENKHQTYEDTVLVEVTSEVGASVTIQNKAIDDDAEVTIGPAGSASRRIRLKYGKNNILATSVDQAGLPRTRRVNVTRLDGRPKVKLKVPAKVKPPEDVRIVAEVTDAKGQPMRDAEVYFTLLAPNQSTDDVNDTTNAKGKAVWEVPVARSSSPAAALEVGVVVISPTGDEVEQSRKIDLQ